MTDLKQKQVILITEKLKECNLNEIYFKSIISNFEKQIDEEIEYVRKKVSPDEKIISEAIEKFTIKYLKDLFIVLNSLEEIKELVENILSKKIAYKSLPTNLKITYDLINVKKISISKIFEILINKYDLKVIIMKHDLNIILNYEFIPYKQKQTSNMITYKDMEIFSLKDAIKGVE